jgi:hypothetical protein
VEVKILGNFAKRLGLQQKIWLTYCIMIVDNDDHWQRSPEMMGTKTKCPKITERFSWMNHYHSAVEPAKDEH